MNPKINPAFLKNHSLSELGLWLLIPFASLTSHTWLPIPPTMVLFLGAIICWFFLQMKNESSHAANDSAKPNRQSSIVIRQFKLIIPIFCLFTLYIFASQYFIGATFRNYMGAVFAPLYLILILIFSEDTDTDFLKNLGQKFIRYSLIILCIEAVLRYSHSFYGLIFNPNDYLGFYSFKFFGPMYLSSNAVACHLVTLLFFMFWWGCTYKQSMKKEIWIALILIALTLSRAAIPTVAIGLFYYAFFRNLNWKKSLYVLFSIGIVGVFAVLALRYVITDHSFQSKFIIIDEAWIYYQTASLKNILFGIGFFETGNIMSYYAHNYFLLFLMETGVVGLILLCATLFILVKITNGAVMIVLIPFIIQTVTESNTFLPYFYVIMALMVTIGIKHNHSQINPSRL